MAFLKYIIDLIIVILLSSCSNQEDKIRNNEEELLSFDVSTLDNKEYEIKLSDLMESVEIVKMDSVQEAFTKIFKVAVSENYFAIHHVNYPVKLYSRKSGKFWGNIGRIATFHIWKYSPGPFPIRPMLPQNLPLFRLYSFTG